MSDALTLTAETRDRAGKGASRALRREGRVPAVIYGNNEEPQGIHVEEKVLIKALSTGHFMNTVVMIDVGGSSVRTLPKDVQFHPVSDRPRSEEPTSELPSLMRISYAVFCLTKKKTTYRT